MNYLSFYNQIGALCTALGYTPTAPAELHQTLHTKGLPIALIEPPVVVGIEGERERHTDYIVNIKLLCDSRKQESLCPEVVARLAADAESLARSLADLSAVLSVEEQEVALVSRPLTVAGEAAVELKARIRTLECRN